MQSLTVALFAGLLCSFLTDEANGSFRPGKKPLNIIMIFTDDQGWADVGWSDHPYRPPTENLRRLKDEGIELMNYITQPKCTAARGALMTGRFPYKIGIATNKVFGRNINTTLDMTLKLMPAYLKDLNYRTHAIGKWHLGFCAKNSTPSNRGFDTFTGSYDNVKSFYKHGNAQGYDWMFESHDDGTAEPVLSADGVYDSELVTDRAIEIIKEHNTTRRREAFFIYAAYLQPHTPLEAREMYKNHPGCRDIPDPKKKIQCGMIVAIDVGVGRILRSLEDYSMLENTVIVYTSDNGAADNAKNSPYPFRGKKQTVYEGGVKVRCLVRAPKWITKKNTGTTYDGLVHVTDWLPTFIALGGGDPAKALEDTADRPIDGLNVFDSVRTNQPTDRMWLPINIDSERNLAAVRYENAALNQSFKLVRWEEKNTLPGYTEDFRDNLTSASKLKKRYPQPAVDPEDGKRWRLFNLKTNPNEYIPCPRESYKAPCTKDAAKENPEIYKMMKDKVAELLLDEVAPPFQEVLSKWGPGRPKQNVHPFPHKGEYYSYYTYGDCECNYCYNMGQACSPEGYEAQTGRRKSKDTNYELCTSM